MAVAGYTYLCGKQAALTYLSIVANLHLTVKFCSLPNNGVAGNAFVNSAVSTNIHLIFEDNSPARAPFLKTFSGLLKVKSIAANYGPGLYNHFIAQYRMVADIRIGLNVAIFANLHVVPDYRPRFNYRAFPNLCVGSNLCGQWAKRPIAPDQIIEHLKRIVYNE